LGSDSGWRSLSTAGSEEKTVAILSSSTEVSLLQAEK